MRWAEHYVQCDECKKKAETESPGSGVILANWRQNDHKDFCGIPCEIAYLQRKHKQATCQHINGKWVERCPLYPLHGHWLCECGKVLPYRPIA